MNCAVIHIREKLRVAQERYEKYANRRRVDLEFVVGDLVFLKVSPMSGVKRFGRNHKLDPRYVGPFQILERIGVSAYRLELPASFPGVHDVFHVSQLRKCVRSDRQILDSKRINTSSSPIPSPEPERREREREYFVNLLVAAAGAPVLGIFNRA
ncbi:hypothetical protein KSP39_PZI017897 [Platanthera zijinensis]|uniref:Tf2-1-like SH3-like domain-containing protein n=1 Tax=Platanthera zijinensis TaxID=2320716 RepID=A0AAP0B4T7_9ASPA